MTDMQATIAAMIDDVIYELNVDAEDCPAISGPLAEKIIATLPKPGITIDLAGAMEKITPDMMDNMRDIMIETLTKRSGEMQKALQPFADCIYNDNGDITLGETHRLSLADFTRAYFANRGAPEGVSAWMPASAPPVNGTVASVLFQYKFGMETLREVAHGAIYRDGAWMWSNRREKDKVLSYHVIPHPPKVK
ncbi:hypothetical protein DSS3P8_177 [Roseobacter phage DSS3P8]|nr:hypothetical protein DSS3P8_177 [Roseobacter phage DSS3P8]